MPIREVSETTTIQLPEICRAGIADLYTKAKAAESMYLLALHVAVSAVGLDPQAANSVDLDTGVITVAEAKGSG